MNLRISPWLAVLTIMITATAQADTFYVDQQHSAADDSNIGTEPSKPFKTLKPAASRAQAGDIIMVRAGIYREAVRFMHSGEPGRPITLQADGQGEVFIRGSSLLKSGWDADTEARKLDPKNKVWVMRDWPVEPSQMFDDGQPLQKVGVIERLSSRFEDNSLPLVPFGKDKSDMVPNSFYYDRKEKALYVWFRDYATYFGPRGGSIDRVVEATVWGPVVSGADDTISYITLRGLTIQHSNQVGGNFSAGVQTTGKGWVIEDCTLSWNDFNGIALNYTDHIVRRCNIHHNGAIGITGRFNERVLIEDTRLAENNTRMINPWWHAGGAKFAKSKTITVQRVVADRNLGPGIWFDVSCEDNTIVDCISQGNSGPGIFYEISKSGVIEHNLVRNNTLHGIFISASSDCIVRNNLVYAQRPGSFGISVHGVPRGNEMLRRNKVTGNVIVAPPGPKVLQVFNNGKEAQDNTQSDNQLFDREPESLPAHVPHP